MLLLLLRSIRVSAVFVLSASAIAFAPSSPIWLSKQINKSYYILTIKLLSQLRSISVSVVFALSASAIAFAPSSPIWLLLLLDQWPLMSIWVSAVFVLSTSPIAFAPSSPIWLPMKKLKNNKSHYKNDYYLLPKVNLSEWCICFECFTNCFCSFISNFITYEKLINNNNVIKMTIAVIVIAKVNFSECCVCFEYFTNRFCSFVSNFIVYEKLTNNNNKS